MAYWKDNADSYLCSACGYECNNPNRLVDGPGKCPECGSKMGMTNADHIRAMTDKELTEFIGHNSLCDRIQHEGTWCVERAVCGNCLTLWLQQPAEEG